MSRAIRFLSVLIGAVVCCIPRADATPITNPYTSFSSWQAALSGSATDLNFPSIPNGSQTTYALGGFTFTGTNMQEANQAFSGSSITVTAPAGGETAMILYIQDQAGLNNATSFTITLSDGETSGPVTLPLNGHVWYGFTDNTAITSLTVSVNSGSSLSIGDLEYGTSSQASAPTAEAGTLLLTCGGLLILFGSGRKLIRRASA
jgi:hypothetical protein